MIGHTLDTSVSHCLEHHTTHISHSTAHTHRVHLAHTAAHTGTQRHIDDGQGSSFVTWHTHTHTDVTRLLAVSSHTCTAIGWHALHDIVLWHTGLTHDVVHSRSGSHTGLTHIVIAWYDQLGAHALSCKCGIGRLSRHGMLNDIVHRVFTSAGIPAMKEPTGLVKGCALRPDGLTTISWAEGRSLAWDVTVTHTLAPTNLVHSVHVAGSAAEAVADRKSIKYTSLSHSHLFVPVAIETHGPLCKAALDLFADLGRAHLGKDWGSSRGCVPVSKSLFRYPAWQRSGSPWQFRWGRYWVALRLGWSYNSLFYST